MYASGDNGIYKSPDAGITWKKINQIGALGIYGWLNYRRSVPSQAFPF